MRKAVLLEHKTKRYNTRSLDQIKEIILHHSATLNGTAESFARYHVNNLNWAGIGYHLVKDRIGIRLTQELKTISYHCSGRNTHSVGICVQGNFDINTPSENDYCGWIDGILYVFDKLGREVPIRLHRDFSSKTCPGENFDINILNLMLF